MHEIVPFDPSKRAPAKREKLSPPVQHHRPNRAVALRPTAVKRATSKAKIGEKQPWDEYIEEPPIGSVVKFSGHHRDYSGRKSPVRYEYAAIRVNNGRWYTTGSSCPAYGFDYLGLQGFLKTLIDPEGTRLV